jgi:phosphatidylinositol-3-phosphatase
MRSRCIVLLAAVVLAAAATGCTGGGGGGGAGTAASSSPPSTTPGGASPRTPSGETSATGGASATASSGMPRPDHVVVVVMENRSYNDIIGNPRAPYINELARGGALFTHSFAVAHPSQPNYLALFSGSTQGIHNDSCPHTFAGPNLGQSLVSAGRTFAGYSEGLPSPGSTVCEDGAYARKHAPWVNFPSVPASANLPFSAFPSDYAALPNLSFVMPDLDHDMHDGTISAGDQWLRDHLGGYAAWASSHHSLLVLTWDEDDRSQANQITTVIAGAPVRPGRYDERIDHYRLLSTLEELEGVPHVGASATVPPVTSIWGP